jgi:hypothetical protein
LDTDPNGRRHDTKNVIGARRRRKFSWFHPDRLTDAAFINLISQTDDKLT